MGNILLVEDDRPLNKGISISLAKDGHRITSAFSYVEALNKLTAESFDLMLLDIKLPDGSGYTLCEHSEDTPVIFITANDTEEDFLHGFKAGCDDYIAKPFSVEVLRQKVLAILRRTGNATQKVNDIQYRDLRIDFDKMLVTVKGQECKLTAAEYRLLEYMVKNRGRVLTRDMLLENVWDIKEEYVDDNTLSVLIKRLRKKIELNKENPEYIITVFGMGYTFGK